MFDLLTATYYQESDNFLDCLTSPKEEVIYDSYDDLSEWVSVKGAPAPNYIFDLFVEENRVENKMAFTTFELSLIHISGLLFSNMKYLTESQAKSLNNAYKSSFKKSPSLLRR